MRLRAGSRCSCHPDRVVRWVVSAVPGIPVAQVSCRPIDTAVWADVRHHDVPSGVELEVRTPELGTGGS